jgi:sulfate adenylyltransferase
MIEDFTGVSDPYEEPEDAEVRVDTAEASPEECVQEVILFLQREGYIGPGA